MSMNFRKITAIVLALAMCISLFGCGKNNANTDANEADPSVASVLYVSSAEDGAKTVVDKDGTPVKGYALDDAGNIVDEHGEIVVKAEQVVEFVPAKTDDDTKSPESSDSKGEESTAGSDNNEKPSSENSDSSSGSGNSGSFSGSGGFSSSNSGEGGQPVHTYDWQHNWQPVYKTIEVPVYDDTCYTFCGACGAKFGINNTDEEVSYHMEAHAIKGESSRTYETLDPNPIGTKIIEDLDYYECFCGAIKEV